MFFPARCGACDRPGWVLCPVCAGGLQPCDPALVPSIAGLDSLACLLSYEGPGRELVARLKYRNNRASVSWLGERLAEIAPAEVAFVTWVPTTAARRRARGFDQAELLARATARALGLAAVSVLRRQRGQAQTGRSRADRLARPIAVVARRRVGGPVLIVDDVVTTGATLAAGAAALARAGGWSLHACAVAHTSPARHRGDFSCTDTLRRHAWRRAPSIALAGKIDQPIGGSETNACHRE